MPNRSIHIHSNTPLNEITIYTMQYATPQPMYTTLPTLSALQYAQSRHQRSNYRSDSRHNSHSEACRRWNIIRSSSTQVPTSNIRQLAVLRQHSNVGADVADRASESTKVRVTLDVRNTIEIFSRRIEETLRIGESVVVKSILGDPEAPIRIPVFSN